MICPCDADRPKVYKETKLKARRRHKCCECGLYIEQGEVYQRAQGLWEDRWLTFKTCADCLHAICEAGCECRVLGQFRYDLREHDDYDRINAMWHASLGARHERNTANDTKGGS